MGRKPKPIGTTSLDIGFKVKKTEIVDILKTIAKREGVNLKEIYNRAFEEYAQRHAPGNYQTLINSYAPGGIKSNGQLEQEIVNDIVSKFTDHEIRYMEIIKKCKSYGFKKDIPATADRIAYELSKKGWRVWR